MWIKSICLEKGNTQFRQAQNVINLMSVWKEYYYAGCSTYGGCMHESCLESYQAYTENIFTHSGCFISSGQYLTSIFN